MVPQFYEFSCPVKIVSGAKAVANLPYEMDLLGARRILVVTDAGVVAAGLMKKVQRAFEGSPCSIAAVFDQTPVDSSVQVVNQVAQAFRDADCDGFVAVGGGSCIDTAKCANMIVAEGITDLAQFQGVERLRKPRKPFIIVPTTAGTGSEVTMVGVIRNDVTHRKMGFASFRLFPDVAILDPAMTLTMPPLVTAATGMDALTHAIEAYYCLQKNPVSDAFAVAAIRLIVEHLPRCVENGGDEQARLAMANGAMLAGIAFSNSMVGIVHALAHACGGICRVPHGVANCILLPWGMESNLDKAGHIIAELGPVLGSPKSNPIEAVRALQRRLNALCGIPLTLRAAGVAEDQLDAIARAAIDDGTTVTNPEEVTPQRAVEILRKAY